MVEIGFGMPLTHTNLGGTKPGEPCTTPLAEQHLDIQLHICVLKSHFICSYLIVLSGWVVRKQTSQKVKMLQVMLWERSKLKRNKLMLTEKNSQYVLSHT